MKKIAAVALLLLSQTVAACVAGPRHPSWSEMLAAAKGAIVVTATREPDSGSHAVFRLQASERIADPRLLFRGKFVLGIEQRFEERGWHDTLTFWRNRPAGGGEFPGNCEFGQFIDPASPHVLLLGVDGPYALEPISGETDRWYVLVKSYFAQNTATKDIVVPMPDLLRRLKPESAAGCRIGDYGEKSVDEFLSCVRSRLGTRGVPVVLQVDGRERREIIASGSEPSFSRKQLVEDLGADFGFEETVTLRSLLEAQRPR